MATISEIRATEKEAVKVSKLCNNTYKVHYKDGSSAVRLHSTNVVTFLPNGNTVLNSSKWRTATTKERINTYSGLHLSQIKSVWYANGHPYYDGITFNGKGELVSENLPDPLKKVKAMKTKIKKFVELITPEHLPMPSGGDCWFCCLRGQNGKTIGNDNNDHLLSHIAEKYMHGSLIYNAMLESGYKNDGQIGLFYSMKWITSIRRAVTKYLQKRL